MTHQEGRHCYLCYVEYVGPEPSGVVLCDLHYAAPALLEALERSISVHEPNVKWTEKEWKRSFEAWLEQARAAIAQAKGETANG